MNKGIVKRGHSRHTTTKNTLRMDTYITSDVPFAAQIEDIRKYILDFEKLKKNNKHIINGCDYSPSHNLKSVYNSPSYSNQKQSHLNQYKNCYQNFNYSSRNPKYKGNNFLNSNKGSYSSTNDNVYYPLNSKSRKNLSYYNLGNSKNIDNNITNNRHLKSEMVPNNMRRWNLNIPNQHNNIYSTYCSSISDMKMSQSINHLDNFQQISNWNKDQASFDSKKALLVKSLYDTYSHNGITNKFDPYQAMNSDHDMQVNYNNKIQYSLSANSSLYLNGSQQLSPIFPTENFNDKVDFLMTNSNLSNTNTFQYDIDSSKKDIFNSSLNKNLIEKAYLSHNFTNSLSPISSNETKCNNNISPVSSNYIIPTDNNRTYMDNSSQSIGYIMPYPLNLFTNSSISQYYNSVNNIIDQKIFLLQRDTHKYKNGENDIVSGTYFGWSFTDIKKQTGIEGSSTIPSVNETNKNISLPNLNKSFKIWNDDMKMWS